MTAPDATAAGRGGLVLLIARLILGGMFVSMGLAKIGDPADFLKLIREYQMVPEDPPLLMNAMAAWMPWLEIWCGALLILGTALRGAALTTLLMLATFTWAVASRALGIQGETGMPFCEIAFDCGCGSGEVNICRKLAENSGLMVLALIAWLSRSRRWCLGPNS